MEESTGAAAAAAAASSAFCHHRLTHCYGMLKPSYFAFA